MTPKIRSVGRGPAGRRYLSSDRELRLGVCFWFRLFNVVPETTARFSYIDDRSRNQSPPCVGTPADRLASPSILPVHPEVAPRGYGRLTKKAPKARTNHMAVSLIWEADAASPTA